MNRIVTDSSISKLLNFFPKRILTSYLSEHILLLAVDVKFIVLVGDFVLARSVEKYWKPAYTINGCAFYVPTLASLIESTQVYS